MPRFVVLTHNHPVLHWDFLLEAGGVLRAWRLTETPDAGRMIAAELLPDHRLHYLDYEGPVSGNRGEVRRWDAGEYTWQACTERQVQVHLSGGVLRGTATLVPADHLTQPSPPVETADAGAAWKFYFAGD
jgi:hypothetical protein